LTGSQILVKAFNKTIDPNQMSESSQLVLPEEQIIKKIILLRGEKVILDVHIAELYQVETRVLKQAVRRNLKRFPSDFMFELNSEEINQVVSQNVIPSKQHLGGAKPYAFTESGVAMLSSVLKSDRAIEMNIAIVRTFIMLRKMAGNYQEIMAKLEDLEGKYEGRFKDIFKALNYLLDESKAKNDPKPERNPIGFKTKNKK